MKTAESVKNKREIIVGETDRKISQKLDAETDNVEFAIRADERPSIGTGMLNWCIYGGCI